MIKQIGKFNKFIAGIFLILSFATSQAFSVDFDVTGYQMALIPSGHGITIPVGSVTPRLYPSRVQNMQFMLFYNTSSSTALYVQSEDASANVSKWEILTNGTTKTLRVTPYKTPAPNVYSTTITIDPSKPWSAAAERYKQWAFNQSWAKRKKSSFDSVKVVALGGSPYFTWLQNYLTPFLDKFPDATTNANNPATATWLTLWRQDSLNTALETNFPRYTPVTSLPGQMPFADLLKWLHGKNSIPMPYINTNLWDNRLSNPDEFSAHNYSSNNMIMDNTGNIVAYSTTQSWLEYVDPSTAAWKEIILQARNRLLDSSSTPKLSTGVYYDVLASAEPILCYNTAHTHGNGNPQIWQESFHWILSQTPGVIMVEGFAENYIDVVDVFLMHDSQASGTKAPLWNAVYGSISRSGGWIVDAANQTPQDTYNTLKEARTKFGSRTWGSPWLATAETQATNSLTYQEKMLNVTSDPNTNYQQVMNMISAAPIVVEDGLSGTSKWYGNVQNSVDNDYGKAVIVKSGGTSIAGTTPDWNHVGYTNARWSIKRTNSNDMMSGFKVTTTSGKTVFLYYTSTSAATLPVVNFNAPNHYVYTGIGIPPICSTCDGWQVIDRDLEADLQAAFPSSVPAETIDKVKQFILFNANGSVADIKLFPRIL